MYEEWIAATPNQLAMILLSTVAVYLGIVTYTRVVGLSSFSKMSSTDFAMTIATGSLFGATIVSPSPTLFMGLFALLCVFVTQWLFSIFRRKSKLVSQLVDNSPLLLMAGSEILHENLKRANMSESDLYGKLREANAFRFEQVLAVVFEPTGDVSVIHSEDENAKLDLDIFSNVVDVQSLSQHIAK